MITKQKDFMDEILGKRLRYIGYCLDLLWMGFGDIIERDDTILNQKEYVAQYSLHIQCPFEIYDNQRKYMVLSSGDTSQFEYNQLEINKHLEKTFSQYCVDEFIQSYNFHNGNLTMQTQKLLINIFGTGDCDEAWRLFKTESNDEHLVCRNGILQFE